MRNISSSTPRSDIHQEFLKKNQNKKGKIKKVEYIRIKTHTLNYIIQLYLPPVLYNKLEKTSLPSLILCKFRINIGSPYQPNESTIRLSKPGHKLGHRFPIQMAQMN